MGKILLIGAGGFVGAVARYGLSGLVHRWLGSTFPYGTLLVNAAGCFAVGALAALVEDRGLFTPEVRLLMLVGFLGSFTTFSTFGLETLELVRMRAVTPAAANVIFNVVLGLTAVLAGRAAGLWLAGGRG